MSFLARLAAGWQRYWFAPQGALDLAMIRITFFGYVYYRYSWRSTDWKTLSDSHFWQPVTFFKLGVPVAEYEHLLFIYGAFSIALLFSALGLFTRLSCWCAFLTGLYSWGLQQNFGKYTGGGVDILLFVMAGFALSRAGDYLSLDSLIRKARFRPSGLPDAVKSWFKPPAPSGEYRWPIRFAWLIFFILYTSAGVSKLSASGLDWALSDNLKYLLIRHHYSHFPPTEIGLWVARHEWLYKGAALATLFFESLCLLGMFNWWLRLIFVLALLGMQYGVRLTMGVTFWGVAVMAWVFVPWSTLLAGVRRILPARRIPAEQVV